MQAYVLARDFFFGSNTTGLVTSTTTSGGNTFVVGGESATLTANALPGASGVVYVGDGATQSTYYFPEATVAAWKKH
jgi:carboxypeptidase D